MNKVSRVLQMIFATRGGGSFRISVSNTLDNLSDEKIKETMDLILASNIFETKTGEIIDKSKARYVTQEIEEINIG